MANVRIYGNNTVKATELDEKDIVVLNIQAAKDIAKRASLGPLFILLAMVALSYSLDSYKVEPFILLSLLVVMALCVPYRAYLLNTVKTLMPNRFRTWRRQFIIIVWITSFT